jgi:hypothetical protein
MSTEHTAPSSTGHSSTAQGGGVDPQATAVAALTEIARRAQPGRDGRRQGPDTAEVITAVVTAAAANVGGLELLLAGRPGSWEAAAVRQLVEGTVGEDETRLWAYRSEPVRLVLDVEDEFSRLGLTELYLADSDTVDATISALDDGAPDGGALGGGDPVDEAAQRAAEELWAVIDRLFDEDLAAYRAGYAEVVAGELARLGRPDLPVQIVAPDEAAGAAERWAPLLDGLHLVAGERTPLPATGRPPDWTTGSPADVVRAAGRSYLDRARAQLTTGDDSTGDGAAAGSSGGWAGAAGGA